MVVLGKKLMGRPSTCSHGSPFSDIFTLQAYFHMCQMPAYSVPANLGQDNILKPHIALGPDIINVCSMHSGKHICGPARSGPANRDKIYGCSKHASCHICGPTRSSPANHPKYMGAPRMPAKICVTATSSPANRDKYMGAPSVPVNIYVGPL